MSSPGYVAQRLWQAIDSLGAPDAPGLREHATHAFQQLVFLNGEDFEDDRDRASFESLMSRATAFCATASDGEVVALSEQGTIADSVQLLPLDELEQVVQELCGLQRKYPFPPE